MNTEMNRKRYSFIMMDKVGFERYERSCKRAGIQCNYHQFNADTFGVMVADERDEDVKMIGGMNKNARNRNTKISLSM